MRSSARSAPLKKKHATVIANLRIIISSGEREILVGKEHPFKGPDFIL